MLLVWMRMTIIWCQREDYRVFENNEGRYKVGTNEFLSGVQM